jgi:outer membrane protein OmpA-like peptidoglycan-associated protein
VPTKEEIRQAAIAAVAKRVADERTRQKEAAAAGVPKPETPPVSPPATPSEIHSADGHIRLNVSATQSFGEQHEELAIPMDTPQSFKQLVVGPTTEGSVEWKVNLKWKYPDLETKDGGVKKGVEGSGFAIAVVTFTVTPEKDPSLVWHIPEKFHADGLGGAVKVRLTPAEVKTEELPNGGTIAITPTITFEEQVSVEDNKEGDSWVDQGKWYERVIKAAASVAKQGDAADKLLGGGVTKHGPGHREQQSFTTTNSYTLSFVAHVKTPARPEPEKLPEAAPLVVLFKVDSDSLAGEVGAIQDWYNKIDKRVRHSIQHGQTPITLLGKASATGTKEHNQDLAHRRAAKVEAILKDLASGRATIITRAIGDADATPGERDEERVVEITVGDD